MLSAPIRLLRHLHIPTWHESAVVVDRKSKFQARHVELACALDLDEILAEFRRQHKNIARAASHPHIYAWRTAQTGASQHHTNIQQGFSDNGEKGAGSRLLAHMELRQVINTVVIVTRWYGGSPIGAARFRHISRCAFDSLRRGGHVQ